MAVFDVEQFILEVKRRPVLWDTNHPEYNHRQAKVSAWEEVACNTYPDSGEWSNYDKFGKVRDIQKKWKTMRDSFVRELKYEKRVEEGLALAKKRKYIYSHLLEFLSPKKKTGECGGKQRDEVQETESSRGEAVLQTTPPRTKPENISFSFLENYNLCSLNAPKTPSPIPKSKVLDVADQLLSIAEREFTLAEAKLPEQLSGLKSLSRNASQPSTARRTMTDLHLSPRKVCMISGSSLESRYRVPQNTPCSQHKDTEKYVRSNGEAKSVKPKVCTHPDNTRTNSNQSDQSSITNAEPSRPSTPNNGPSTPLVTQFTMFYEQQKLIEKKKQNIKEKDSTTVIFQSDAKVISCDDILSKQNVETNTDQESLPKPIELFRNTPNSSIICMKTNKPEPDDIPTTISRKMLSVRKMPSVNIRPEFKIQPGPKINIIGSNSKSYQPKNKNTEYFDVVYPPHSHIFNGSVLATDRRDQNRAYQMEYVCERHVFPSGKLVPGDAHKEKILTELSLDEKKAILIDLIKSVSEKIEKQTSSEKMCCRLNSSLPLLASVVNKIQVDCVKCVDILNKHIDTLIQLMKEELRCKKQPSEDHCCQMDETVKYQIVELELMQEENYKYRSEPVQHLKQSEREINSKVPKKTVSFESIPSEIMRSTKQSVLEVKTNCKKSKLGTKITLQPKLQCPRSVGSILMRPPATNTRNNRLKTGLTKQSSNTKICKTKGINSSFKKTENPAEKVADKTVINQVIQQISARKSILKSDSTLENPSIPGSKSIAFYTITDQKEPSSDFDRWVKERSLKIQKIHEELNKMVTESMEKNLDTQTQDYELIEKLDKNSKDERLDINMRQQDQNNLSALRENQRRENDERQVEKDLVKAVSSQEEYAEDFEEDIEENHEEELHDDSKQLDSEDSHNETLAEAESVSSSSTNTINVNTHEDLEESSVTHIEDSIEEQASVKSQNQSVEEVQTLLRKPPQQSGSKHDSPGNLLAATSVTQSAPNSKEQTTVNHISIATSPINFKIPEEMYPLNKSVQKINTGTSPINLNQQERKSVRSTTVQTENSGIEFPNSLPKDSGVETQSNKDNMELFAPAVKLNPTPVENILHVSVSNISDNSVAFQTNSSNETMKLIVQLPCTQKDKSDKIIELDSSEKPEDDRGYAIKTQSKQKNQPLRVRNYSSSDKTKLSSTVEEESYSPKAGSSQNNCPLQQSLSEQTIKDIIGPTVSEVLNILNINTTKTNQAESKMKETCELEIPSVILQTRHGMWTKCDNNPVYGFLDGEYSKPAVDSSNQTEAQKQNICIQVTESLAGSVSDKAVSVRKCNESAQDYGRSYLEMLQLLRASKMDTAASSGTPSNMNSSSRSSSSSSRKEDKLSHSDKLSEGEVVLGPCNCIVGDICSICVPRLDLSFGELKTKQKTRKRGNISSTDTESEQCCSILNSGIRSLSDMPLHLEPRPNIAYLANFRENKFNLKENEKYENVLDKTCLAMSKPQDDHKKESKFNVRPFSEVVNIVMSELNKEHSKNVTTSDNKTFYSERQNFSSNKSEIVSSLQIQTKPFRKHSSTSKSSKGSTSCKSKFRAPLVIRSPTESPKIDVVIEDPEDGSLSSYQTSVTSVSVDTLPPDLSSNSSGELAQLSPSSS